jgi:hypothetical protein
MKKIKTIFLVILTVFTLGISHTPVKAQVPLVPLVGVGVIVAKNLFAGEKTFIEIVTDAVGENVVQMVSKLGNAALLIPIASVCPQCTDAEAALMDSDLPYSMKVGLVGVMDDQIHTMFRSQPRIDVIAHLSEEWVPGYRESQSIYAEYEDEDDPAKTGYDDLMRARVDNLWSFTRNIAYAGFVLIMIIIGFMIMFRSKVGGQTMVTIGNTLPRMVVSLVLVTFSFAIIGLIFDVAGFITGLISSVLGSNVPIHNMPGLIWATMGEGGGLGYIILSSLGFVASFIALRPGAMFTSSLHLALVGIVLAIIVWGAIKLWITLVKTYLLLLLNTVIAPIAILLGAMPGSVSTVNIFKSILRHALVFPLAFAIVNIPYYLTEVQGVTLIFPSSILRTNTFLRLSSDGFVLGAFVGTAMSILSLYIAAKSPEYINAIIPPSQPKGGVDVGAITKESLGKVPVVKRFIKDKR